MIQSAFLADNHGSKSSKSANKQTLLDAIEAQISAEKASFHTPGHKGRLSLRLQGEIWNADLTELPGLDELAESAGVLEKLQNRIAKKWNSRRSFISVNGASAALCAAIVACAGLGTKIVLPRNVHRSALNALIISGLDPLWYEAEWLDEWQCWGAANEASLNDVIANCTDSIAAVVICSPSYSGSVSNIEAIAKHCHKRGIQLIVDEAHGAHLLKQHRFQPGALNFDADLVVHSLHKTLSAPTQTGALHVNHNCVLSDMQIKVALNMLQSSSPSYLLMLGIEAALDDVDAGSLEDTQDLSINLRKAINSLKNIETLETASGEDPLHVLIKHNHLSAEDLYTQLSHHGIFAETILGNGVLLLLGSASKQADLDHLVQTLLSLDSIQNEKDESFAGKKPTFAPQDMNPRKAFFAKSSSIPIEQAPGRIACDYYAPCPPGYALIAPGQKYSQESIKVLTTETVRVVTDPQLQGDSDGPHTAS